jgi:hypothetical protein
MPVSAERNIFLLVYSTSKLKLGAASFNPDYSDLDEGHVPLEAIKTGIHGKGDNFAWRALYWVFKGKKEGVEGIVTIQYPLMPSGFSVGGSSILEDNQTGITLQDIRGGDKSLKRLDPMQGDRPTVMVNPIEWPSSGELFLYDLEDQGGKLPPLSKIDALVGHLKNWSASTSDLDSMPTPSGSSRGKEFLVRHSKTDSRTFRVWNDTEGSLTTITGDKDAKATKAVMSILKEGESLKGGDDFDPQGISSEDAQRFASFFSSSQTSRGDLALEVLRRASQK